MLYNSIYFIYYFQSKATFCDKDKNYIINQEANLYTKETPNISQSKQQKNIKAIFSEKSVNI